MNGNRYRSWTRVGSRKKAIARIVTPVRITSGLGRRATRSDTITNAAMRSAAPTRTAGIGPTVTAWGQKVPPAAGVRMTESQAQLPFAARPEPPIDASAQGLYALTLAYGYSPAVLNISNSRPDLIGAPPVPGSITDSPNGKHRAIAVRNPANPVVTIRIG